MPDRSADVAAIAGPRYRSEAPTSYGRTWVAKRRSVRQIECLRLQLELVSLMEGEPALQASIKIEGAGATKQVSA